MASDTPISSAPQSGMRDFSPAEVRLRDWATSVITGTYEGFGFTKIETPALENINLLRGGEGGENLKLIFEVLKRGDKLDKVLTEAHSKAAAVDRLALADMGLRFDLTVPLVRFYSNNQNSLPSPFKSIQIGSVWRAESSQKGRYRQFTQCDIDIFGIKSEIAEIELLQATSEALIKLGFADFTICINDRRILASVAAHCGFEESRFDSVFIELDKMDKIGLDGVVKGLTGDGHPPQAVAALKDLLLMLSDKTDVLDSLAATTNADALAVKGLKTILSVVAEHSQGRYQIKFEPTLVRGMGYYTGPIFEIKCEGQSSSVAGGGRYDKMVAKMSGRDVPACGFSIGFERIVNILTDQGFTPPGGAERLALIFDPERDQISDVVKAAEQLRNKGFAVSTQVRKKDMKKQIEQLSTQGLSKLCLFKGDPNNLEVKDI